MKRNHFDLFEIPKEKIFRVYTEECNVKSIGSDALAQPEFKTWPLILGLLGGYLNFQGLNILTWKMREK